MYRIVFLFIRRIDLFFFSANFSFEGFRLGFRLGSSFFMVLGFLLRF